MYSKMEVMFDREKCSLYKRCLVTCTTRAMGLFSQTGEQWLDG